MRLQKVSKIWGPFVDLTVQAIHALRGASAEIAARFKELVVLYGLADDRVLLHDVPANIVARLHMPEAWLRDQIDGRK